MTRTKKALIAVGALLVAGGAAFVGWMGPRNVIGMLRYDQREEGQLKVGEAAPDVEMVALAEGRREKLSAYLGDKPLVLIFGSFT
ncbi:hypothetical protein [Polyangium sorediatum]|uniref:Alkyl hydroperoxide reductase subunit C/ Thiol specific antioxidant domain-containing protein n=1 Tax=Polyangium sorediatum TaxID=889274 RepID=A0ABT6NLH4_9BACT|nr:hypothetical protein [Polyangium sorediatum]MDI1429158.1 hypothetical protein [Polyangium sorediatum]